MSEITISRGDEKDEITLLRGGKKITFKKVPDAFAVRLKQGRAENEAALSAAAARVEADVTHVDARPLEKLDVFHVNSAAALDETMETLREAPNTEVVSHVYTVDKAGAAEVIPTGTMTIQFKSDTKKEEREQILAEHGLEIVADLDFIEDGYTVRLTDASTENPLKIALKLQNNPKVAVAEPDITVPTSFEHTPADALYVDQWHLNNRGDRVGLKAGADVKAEQAWDISRGKRAIKICVIDDGFDLAHPEFNGAGKVRHGRDFLDNDFDPSPTASNDNHGTACAGVALAEENGEGVVGLAPKSTLIPVRLSNISDNAIVAYFQHAIDSGADVVSCSWSATPWNFPLSLKMHGIIHKAATQGRNGKGCVILFAAGNQSRPLDGVKDGRISHQGFALHPDVITVAASNSLDQHASYSNFGREVALCAPSSGAPGRRVVTTDRRGTRGYDSGDYTFDFGGTSSATPLAAGLAALILTIHPDLTAAEVKEIMMETADKIDEANGGYVNGHSELFGHGRINAFAALQRTKALKGDTNGHPPPDDTPPPDDRTGTLEIIDVGLSVVSGRLLNETRFRISDGAAWAAARLRYRNEMVLINRDSGAETVVASREGRLEPHRFDYNSQLTFPVPGIGEYNTRSEVTLFTGSGEVTAAQPGRGIRVR